jgi:hypothetical protein
MLATIHLESLKHDIELEITGTKEDADRLWRMIVAMGIRDHASSIHYQPYAFGHALYYIVDWVQYGLVTPPEEFAKTLVESIKMALTKAQGNSFTKMLKRLIRSRVVHATIDFVAEQETTTWDVVAWSGNDSSGAAFYRVSPIPNHSKPLPAAADAIVGEA